MIAITGRGLPAGWRPLVRRWIRATLAHEGARAGEIGVRFADDATLRDLNRRWRRIDRATDVLSFPYEDAPSREHRVVTGDLVISVERWRANAKRYRTTPRRELARLLVHGALHLCGHDHHRPGERARMRRAERAVLGRTSAGAV